MLAATAALAVAQAIDNPPDGGPPQPAGPNVQYDRVRPEPDEHRQDRYFADRDELGQPRCSCPAPSTQVVVPDGQSRCIKVRFTAESACEGPGAADFCYVRALIDGVPMDPNGGGFQALDSEDGTASAHAYEWVKRVGEGPHTVRIERRVGNAATMFWADDWTFDTSIFL